MRTRTKLFMVGLAAAMLMVMAVGSASANRLSINERRIRITWVSLEFEGSPFGAIRCKVTMEGSFHSATINKVVGALIGHMSRAAVSACTNGSATVLLERLPWHVTYESFAGTLPRITSATLLLRGAAFRLAQSIISCLAITGNSAAENARGIAEVGAGGETRQIRADPNPTIDCGGLFSGRFNGTGQIFRLGTTAQDVRITLI